MKSFAEPRFGMMGIIIATSLLVGLVSPVMHAAAMSLPTAQDANAQSKGEAALTRARQAYADQRWREAADAYAEALNYLPGNEEATAGLSNAQTMLNQGSGVSDVARTQKQLADQARIEFDEDYKTAEQRLKEDDFDSALTIINNAKARLDSRQNVLSASDYEKRAKKATDLSKRIEEARTTYLADLAIKNRDKVEQDRTNQQQAAVKERERQVNERLRRVYELQKELKYREAMQVLDEILFIEPLNQAAMALRDVIRATMLYREYADIQKEREYSFTGLAVDARGSMIAPQPNITGPGPKSLQGVLVYPEDWPELSIRRGGEGGYQESAADRQVRQILTSQNIQVDFNNNTFEQVIDFFRQVTGLKVHADWKALNTMGVNKEDQVTLQLSDVNAGTALARIMEQLGPDERTHPKYAVEDGLLIISSDEAIRARVILLVYDIRDLLMQVPNFDNAPTLDLNNALNQGQGGGGGGGTGGGGGAGGGGGGGTGGGGGAGGGGGVFGNPKADPERATREELVGQIVDIIQNNVDPDGWRDLGGSTGSLQELNGNLIITNTPGNHRDIEGLLSQLREIRALQINVESRFMTVSTDWFEKIGVDLDLYFNTNNAAYQQAQDVDPTFRQSDFFDGSGRLKDPVVFGNPTQVNDPTPGNPYNTVNYGSLFGVPNAAIPIQGQNYLSGPVGAPIRATDGFAPIGVNQQHNSLIGKLAEFAGDSFAGVALSNPALAVGIQFLDDVQVDLLIEATQADRRSVTLTAPRLTFFNGQRSWIAVTTQTSYVASLTAVTGDASGAFQPDIATLQDGFVLDVEGVISSDRRYVTMTVIFDFAEFLGFRTSDASEFGGGAGGGGTSGGNAAQFTGSIELPILRGSRVRTTVSVPDKGTVLLGGQRHVRETEVETGVPVLSKIPIVNRFFTNRVTAKEEQTLLILIRPEIIIQQENEDMLFPGLGNAVGGSAGSYVR